MLQTKEARDYNIMETTYKEIKESWFVIYKTWELGLLY